MSRARHLGFGEKCAHMVEQACISSQIGARRSPDGSLVDSHQALDALHSTYDLSPCDSQRLRLKAFHFFFTEEKRITEVLRHQFDQRLAYQAGLA